MRAAWVVVIACACGASQQPRSSAPVVHGRISVAASVDPKLPRTGTMFMFWLTKDEAATLAGTSLDLRPLARLLDRLTVIGPVDLAHGSAEYTLPVERGDVIVTAVLDTQHDGIGSLLGAARTVSGDLTGDSAPVHVDARAEADISMGQILGNAGTAPEACRGANHELVTLDAPEVAGAMGNARPPRRSSRSSTRRRRAARAISWTRRARAHGTRTWRRA